MLHLIKNVPVQSHQKDTCLQIQGLKMYLSIIPRRNHEKT